MKHQAGGVIHLTSCATQSGSIMPTCGAMSGSTIVGRCLTPPGTLQVQAGALVDNPDQRISSDVR